MNVLLVLAHPERRSFNGAMFDLASQTLREAGHTVATSDLYRIGFDPLSSRRNFSSVKDPDYLKPQIEELHATDCGGFAAEVESELVKLEAADLMIWQFPLWWFGLPAALKGWVDRVFAMGRVYGQGHIYGSGRFRGRRALLSLTTGGPQPAYERGGFNGDIDAILRPIQRGMLEFVGYSVLRPQIVYAPVRADAAQRDAWLAEWAQRLRALDGEAPIEVGPY
jgi:NAD(P)H dehydrogenase (quinone)